MRTSIPEDSILWNLKQSLTFHTYVVRVADDDVVEDFDAQQFACFHQPLVQADIQFGGGGVAGGVID